MAVATLPEVELRRETMIPPMPDRHAYQAYRILQFGFIVAPIVAGVDKFLNLLTNWPMYLSPLAERLLPIPGATFMKAVGVIEVVAGVLVAVKPRIGGVVVGLWLLGIIANLLSVPGFYDIALRDLGLALGAFALAQLAASYDTPRRNARLTR